MTYSTFQTVPAYVTAVWETGRVTNRHEPMLWSGSLPPPAIGTVVPVTMNGCGAGKVTAYFQEDGWLGVLVALDKVPMHNGKRNPIIHMFGAEL